MGIINQKITLLALLVFSGLIRFSIIFFLEIEPVSDYASYMMMATSLIDTGVMDDGQGNIAFYSAGYPILLVPFFIIFGSNPEVPQVLNAVLGVVSTLLVYLCAKQTLPSWKWAVIPAFLWATYPPAILYTEYVAKENLMVTLLLLQTYMLLLYFETSRPIMLSFLLGVILGVELLVGPAIILTGLLIGLMLLKVSKKEFITGCFQYKPLLACSLGCAIILAPWLSYTTANLGKPILNTNGGFNFYIGNNPNAEVHFVGIQDTPIGPKWHDLKEKKGEVLAMDYLKDQALNHILENPWKTTWLSIQKIAYFWKPPIHEGKGGNKSAFEGLVRLGWAGYYMVIILFALVPLFFMKSLTKNHAILYGTVVLYCFIHGAAYVIFRYRLPIMPVMSLLSASGLNFAYLWWVARKRGRLRKAESDAEIANGLK